MSPPSRTTGPILYIYISFNRVSGYCNVSTYFFFIVTFRHFMGHNTVEGASGFAERSRERRASETASVAPSNIRLDMLSSKC